MVALAGCAVGQRPTLVAETPIDDAPAQTVLDRLGRGPATFTATYDITPSTTGIATPATVVQDGERRKVTIGSVVFRSDGATSSTCQGAGECEEFLDDARVSDLNITNRFWGPAFASRLELDASRRIGFSLPSTDEIAGRPAACVDVVVPSATESSGTVVYCAIDDGVLARYFGADVSIELTSFSLQADPAALV